MSGGDVTAAIQMLRAALRGPGRQPETSPVKLQTAALDAICVGGFLAGELAALAHRPQMCGEAERALIRRRLKALNEACAPIVGA